MKRIAFFVLPLILASQTALAASTEGNGALSLAALVAQHAPQVKAAEKALLVKYLDGKAKAAYPAGKKITVTADQVSCHISNVDITTHRCDLTFGAKKIALSGRAAHELYATLAEVGGPSGGAAGSIYEAVPALDCTVNPDEVKQEAGGGASCKFTPAP